MYPRRPAVLVAFVLLGLLLRPISSRAGTAADCHLGSYAAFVDLTDAPLPYFGAPCSIIPNGFARFYVQVKSIPFRKMRLTIPDSPGVLYVVSESWGASFTGNHLSGVELDMGRCTDPGEVTVVGYMDVILLAPDSPPPGCSHWMISQQSEIQACNGEWRPIWAQRQFIAYSGNDCFDCPWQVCAGPLPPYDLNPPDGATGVPTNVVLSWTNVDAPYPPEYPASFVQISTSSVCYTGGLYATLNNEASFAPDFLKPGTTYYWQPIYGSPDGACQDTNGQARGPVYSFTTAGPLATNPTTWGHVKSLYRE